MHKYTITAEIKEDKSWVELESIVKKMKANFVDIVEINSLKEIIIVGHQIHNTNLELFIPEIKEKKKKKEIIKESKTSFDYRLDVFIKSKDELNVKWIDSLIKEKEHDKKISSLLKLKKTT